MGLGNVRRRCGAAAIGVAAGLGAASTAWAVECKDLPAPVYGIGGSAQKPFFAKVGKALSAANPPETLVYQAPGACLGVNAILSDVKLTGTASYWTAAGTEQTCDLPLVGQAADYGSSAVFAGECPGVDAVPADVGDFSGPITPFVFIVSKASAETVISGPAGYFVYGFGEQGQASPWTDEANIVKRDPNSAAAIVVAKAIGVPVEKLKGVDAGSNGQSVTLVAESQNPGAAIGFVSSEFAEANLSKINILAFQAYDQTCGYWPSSTSTGFDKRNVRDGHYALWAASHFYAKVDAGGEPVTEGAQRIIGYFTGTKPAPAGVDIQKIAIEVGAIPECAMRVKRTEDVGPLASYAPENPCGCFFEATATGSTTCTACQGDGDCAAGGGKCRFGYCEEY